MKWFAITNRNPAEIVTDPELLRQVLCNLLTNNLDAVGDDGRIRLRISGPTSPIDNRVRLTISDNGRGIHPSIRHQVFEPLFTTKGNTGTGLGLWTSKRIIEKGGGKLYLRSSVYGPRRGTSIIILLPASIELGSIGSS